MRTPNLDKPKIDSWLLSDVKPCRGKKSFRTGVFKPIASLTTMINQKPECLHYYCDYSV